MKRTLAASTLVFAVLVPAVALAKPPTVQHVREYNQLRRLVVQKYGRRAPGRNIVRYGTSDGRAATDAGVVASIGVFERALAPSPRAVVQTVSTAVSTPTVSAPTQYAPVASAPSSGVASCIIRRESGGSPSAVNGQYSGIAQWSPTSWAQGGGTRYASSPTGASYGQQVQVLNNMLANGQAGQWTPYDGC